MSGCEILLAAMGQANVEIVRAAYESFQATGQFAETVHFMGIPVSVKSGLAMRFRDL